MDDKNFIINLEKHPTKDTNDFHINGELTVIWRDWDKIFPKNPEMVYVNTVNAKEIKGPHLHKNRTTYFYCISGEIVIIIEDSEGKIYEISANSNIPILIVVPNKLAAAIINPTAIQSTIEAMPFLFWAKRLPAKAR